LKASRHSRGVGGPNPANLFRWERVPAQQQCEVGNSKKKELTIPSGIGSTLSSESLIMAQDERWRRA
jgi:hypothetical protein